MSRKAVLVVVLAMLGVAVATFLYLDQGSSSKERTTVGSILILSGSFQSYGEQFRDGVALAQEELRNQGRADDIDVLFFDSQGVKRKAVELVERLRQQYDAHYLADIMGTGLALEAVPTINELHMLVVSGVNTGPELTTKGGPYFFRIIPSDGVAAVQIAQWARDLGYERAAVVHDVDEWAQGLLSELKRAYSEQGGTFVSDVECPKGFEVFSPLVSRVQAADPQVVFLLLYPREAGLFLKEAKRHGFEAAFMGTDNFTGEEVVEHAGDAAEGALFVVPGETDKGANKVYDRFTREFEEKYGSDRKPELFSVTGYDVMMIIADLVKRFGDDTKAAAEYLHSATYQGASGKIQFDKNGDVRVDQYRRMEFKKTDDGIVAAPYSG